MVPPGRGPSVGRRAVSYSDEGALAANDVVLTTTGTETDDDIEPIPDYVDQRLEGAAAWSPTFHEEFLRTTETNSGRSLADHVE